MSLKLIGPRSAAGAGISATGDSGIGGVTSGSGLKPYNAAKVKGLLLFCCLIKSFPFEARGEGAFCLDISEVDVIFNPISSFGIDIWWPVNVAGDGGCGGG